MSTTTPARSVRRRLLTAFAAVTVALGIGAVAAPAATAAPSPWWNWDAPGWGWQQHAYEGVWYTSPHGTFAVDDGYPDFDAVHRATGGGGGQLGYPTGSERSESAGYYQTFERGVIYHSFRGTYALRSSSAITQVHNRHGGGGGVLGYPAGHEVNQGGGWWYRSFGEGTVYISPRGSFAVTGDLDDEHRYQGGGGGLGYPTAPRRQDAPGFGYQTFERGIVYCMPYSQSWESCDTVKGGFLSVHARYGGGGGALGYPTMNEYYSSWDGSWVQSFERGTVRIYGNGRVTVS